MPAGKQDDIPLEGTESILVVEDEEQLLELAKSSLELYGYTVITAKSPGDAILLCERSNMKFDLLITDVVMPGMNGKELQERLDVLKPGMKVIFMSGYTADVVAHRGILDEGVNFLQKPFTPRSLARKAREVLNG
jgi:DNA-binding NtrC family response regulator